MKDVFFWCIEYRSQMRDQFCYITDCLGRTLVTKLECLHVNQPAAADLT